ncbi:uncharacterized protein SPPG_02057 [Spizellomyces punctatus DAOM BR117]|uniref:Uncharacterized protein n=1 Tax=Spizellomyces punctatus (strain DAOM BR117) TaxID=645134 RepID=A0A0L0HPG3_SPIPD|nr:uncharacterized protein SPPG_02057 [Spizellomyces punctatus DAOM BR117]KND02982.1 hypothetical protein SPPG_02057 [Spizellomyces punctatus DAOM BR117]|eukprot:XP_016611021.1 hypothetical protein SPPG_02057 [Spizellomyces punctatus DAOM BR117]
MLRQTTPNLSYLIMLRPPSPDPFIIPASSSSSKRRNDLSYDLGTGFVPPIGHKPTVPRSRVLHTHIYPSFARKVPISRVTKKDAEKSFNNYWDRIRDPQALCLADDDVQSSTWMKNFVAQTVTGCIHLRISVNSFTPGPFPQQHIINLVDTKDPFARWTYSCTPFSFRTLAKSAGWDATERGEDLFLQFGGMLKERINACVAEPKRFTTRLDTIKSERISVLTFFETIRGYRRVQLLKLELNAVKWEQLQEVVQNDFLLLKAHHDQVTTCLIQTLEVISRHEPSILLNNTCNSDEVIVNQPPDWMQAVQDYLGPTDKHQSLSDPSRKKAFVLATQKRYDELEALQAKSLPLYVHGQRWPQASQDDGHATWFNTGSIGEFKPEAERYILTIFRKARSAYILTLHHPTRPFFHFTSEDLTESRFETMMHGVDLVESGSTKSDDSARNIKVGFHPDQGVGGVVAVIFDDLISGCCEDSERYQAHFEVHPDRYVSKKTPAKRATLIINQRILPDERWHPLLKIGFGKTGRDRVADDVRDKLMRLQTDIDVKLSRLYSILGKVRDCSPELLCLTAQLACTLPVQSDRPLDDNTVRVTGEKAHIGKRFPSPERTSFRGSQVTPPRTTCKAHPSSSLPSYPHKNRGCHLRTKTTANISGPRDKPGKVTTSQSNIPQTFRTIIKGIAEKAVTPGDPSGLCDWLGPSPPPTPATLVPELYQAAQMGSFKHAQASGS